MPEVNHDSIVFPRKVDAELVREMLRDANAVHVGSAAFRMNEWMDCEVDYRFRDARVYNMDHCELITLSEEYFLPDKEPSCESPPERLIEGVSGAPSSPEVQLLMKKIRQQYETWRLIGGPVDERRAGNALAITTESIFNRTEEEGIFHYKLP